MAIEIFMYDLLDWGGNVEETKPMTEAEAKAENKWLWEKQPRLLQWAKSCNQKPFIECQTKKQRSRN